MSFSSALKKDLTTVAYDKKHRKLLLFGMLISVKHFDQNALRFSTENVEVASLLKRLIFSCYGECEITEKSTKLTVLQIDNSELLVKLLADFEHVKKTSGDTEIGLFLRGVFLGCGFMRDPKKDYHLEMVFPNEEVGDFIEQIILEHGLKVKKMTRQKLSVLYIKESEAIEDFLTFIGATSFSLEVMNVKIYKDFRNKVNRSVNCESANLDKTISAAHKQTEAIRKIFAVKGENYLEPDLRELALIRLENPEMSLRELGEQLVVPISRSGVNHRLRKIIEIADML